MESFVSVSGWRSAALLFNLLTFFFAFSAFSVGLLISSRVRRVMGKSLLRGIVNSFLIAAAALAFRALIILLFHLHLVPEMVAIIVSDLAMLAVGGGVFMAYLVFERFLKSKESV